MPAGLQREYWCVTADTGFPGGTLPMQADLRDMGLIPGSGRSPGGEQGNPRQYSCLENPTDRGAYWDTIHGVAKAGHDQSDLAFRADTDSLWGTVLIGTGH